MNATIRGAPWQVGHARGSTSKICCSSAAQQRVVSVGASLCAETIAGGATAGAVLPSPAALPGFVVDYGLSNDGALSTAAAAYSTTVGWSVASIAVVLLAVREARIPSSIISLLIAAVAEGLSYWFAGPSIARATAAPLWVVTLVLVAGIALVLFWLGGALCRPTLARSDLHG